MIPYRSITLKMLKANAFVFQRLSQYDSSYILASQDPVGTPRSLDPRRKSDGRIILKFLRAWGCRHLAKSNESYSLRNLRLWYNEHHEALQALPSIHKMAKVDILTIMGLFTDLSNCSSSPREKKIRIGVVAASKILLLLKRDLFAPWDTMIAEKLEVTQDAQGYIEYLQRISRHLKELRSECRKKNTSIPKVLESVGRPMCPLPKAIDEFYYLKYTRGWDIGELVKLIS